MKVSGGEACIGGKGIGDEACIGDQESTGGVKNVTGVIVQYVPHCRCST